MPQPGEVHSFYRRTIKNTTTQKLESDFTGELLCAGEIWYEDMHFYIWVDLDGKNQYEISA